MVVECAQKSSRTWAIPFALLDTVTGLALAKGGAAKRSVTGMDLELSVPLSAMGSGR